jgi:hypothetical protein
MTEEHKLTPLLNKRTAFSPDDFQQFRDSLHTLGNYSQPTRDYLSARFSVDTLEALGRLNASIRGLDETSTRLVRRTNQLTIAILVLTVIAVVISGLQLVAP